jgi:hypothetical protein
MQKLPQWNAQVAGMDGSLGELESCAIDLYVRLTPNQVSSRVRAQMTPWTGN